MSNAMSSKGTSPAPVLLGCLLFFSACARKSEATKEASANAIQSEDEICKLLTDEEVAAEMKQPVTGRRMPSSGQYSAPSCGWLTAEADDSPGFTVTLFFHPDATDAPGSFKRKVKDVCSASTYFANKPPEPPRPTEPIEGLGDEAALCRKLLVRKGNNFFFIDQKGDSAVPWQEGARRLAAKVVSRLP
ncbi:MAG: hypothetical protein ABI895_40105 [Deltaproteobacteria bacterium]